MSPKAFIISLSLTGAAVTLGCLFFAGEKEAPDPVVAGKSKVVRPVASKPAAAANSTLPDKQELRAAGKIARTAPAAPQSTASAPTLSLEARAAKIEQEANHDLRRLVGLLNLDEQQQDQVFQTLAQRSRYWTPEMQVASPAVSAAGRRAELVPGTFIPGISSPGTNTAPVNDTSPVQTTAPADEATTDPMTEILALLTPEQQAVLLEDEMDRTTWWAEVLPQIMPADDVPMVPEVQTYEGSDVLE